jgi:hypothetical protein
VLINRSALSLILFILSHSLTGIFLLVVVEVLVTGLRRILCQFSLLLKKLRFLELRHTSGPTLGCCLLHLLHLCVNRWLNALWLEECSV